MDAVNFTSDYKLLYNLHVQLEHPPPTVVRKCIAEGGNRRFTFSVSFIYAKY